MNEQRYSIEIHASKPRVWQTLWQDASFRDWASLIDPETYMTGELKQGGEVQFRSAENGYGVTSLVEKLTDGEFVLLRHSADTQHDGTQTRDKQWTGGKESYQLIDNGATTTLDVAFDVPTELEDYFNEAYPKALERIKSLAEGADR